MVFWSRDMHRPPFLLENSGHVVENPVVRREASNKENMLVPNFYIFVIQNAKEDVKRTEMFPIATCRWCKIACTILSIDG